MRPTLEGKNILITGGGSREGVGAGVVEGVAELGGRLLINDVDEEAAREVAGRHDGAVALPGDVSRPEDVDQVFGEAERSMGPVHGLVNNAGVGLSKPPHEADEADYDRVHGVDLRGVWLLCRGYLRQLFERAASGEEGFPGGSIVNISSVHAECTIPGHGLYAAAKSGVEGLTRGLAVHYGPQGVRCNAVAPGYVHSEQNRELLSNWTDDAAGWVDEQTRDQQAVPAPIEPIDCGRVVAFLLSDASRAVTGQVLRVDAGLTSMLYNREFVT